MVLERLYGDEKRGGRGERTEFSSGNIEVMQPTSRRRVIVSFESKLSVRLSARERRRVLTKGVVGVGLMGSLSSEIRCSKCELKSRNLRSGGCGASPRDWPTSEQNLGTCA